MNPKFQKFLLSYPEKYFAKSITSKISEIIITIYENPSTDSSFKKQNFEKFIKFVKYASLKALNGIHLRFLQRIEIDTENSTNDGMIWIEALGCCLKNSYQKSLEIHNVEGEVVDESAVKIEKKPVKNRSDSDSDSSDDSDNDLGSNYGNELDLDNSYEVPLKKRI